MIESKEWDIKCPHCADGYCKQILNPNTKGTKYRIICSCGKIDVATFFASKEIFEVYEARKAIDAESKQIEESEK